MIRMIHSLLSRTIFRGNLTVIDADGAVRNYGDGVGKPVTIHLMDRRIVLPLLLNPELVFAEAYVDGRLLLRDGDIYSFLELMFTNLSSTASIGWSSFANKINYLLRHIHQRNNTHRSKDNVAHHYDLDGRLYRLFLDEDWQYSCAYFETASAGLAAAQQAKKRHIAAKLLIQPKHRVLDIGSGWGGLALYLARATGADVTGVTLSEEQHSVANVRARQEELSDRARFLLRDYRHVEGQFDRIASVGMFEHVGVRYYDDYFSRMRELLTEEGVAVIHSIGRSDGPSYTNPWIRKYIFPGGYIPALSEVLPSIERQGLVVCDIEILRLHYAETLRLWRERFLARRGDVIDLYDDRFARLWEFYLAASETAFRFQGLMVFQIQIARNQSAVPLTRDYIVRAEEQLKAAGH